MVSNLVYEISKMISDAKEMSEDQKRRLLRTILNSKYGKQAK
jgi:hypothetical protein